MNWYDDDYYIPETVQERFEREERERQARIELRRKQLACLHNDRYQTGHGCTMNVRGEIYEYVTTECPDCWLEQEIEKGEWEAVTA